MCAADDSLGAPATLLALTALSVLQVGPALLEVWYQERIKTEGRWRTFARINSDSGHACSSTLHAKALGQTHPGHVWRYFFDFVAPGSKLPGATHGGDESWLLRKATTTTAGELALSTDMADWWTTLGRTLTNPNDARKQVCSVRSV